MLRVIFGLLVLMSPSLAQGVFPDRPIRIVVPINPGGGTDIFPRALAEIVGNSLGQPIITEDRAGAGPGLAALDDFTLVVPPAEFAGLGPELGLGIAISAGVERGAAGYRKAGSGNPWKHQSGFERAVGTLREATTH